MEGRGISGKGRLIALDTLRGLGWASLMGIPVELNRQRVILKSIFAAGQDRQLNQDDQTVKSRFQLVFFVLHSELLA